MLLRNRWSLVLAALSMAFCGELAAQDILNYEPWPRLQSMIPTGGEPFGAEDKSAEDDVPRIPEPMVFDLVRPLGARQGEFEINTLGIIPIGRAPRNTLPDALGLPGSRFEWAPEIEYAVRDGFAVEFELPFESTTLAAYKAAAQWTFGTAFDRHYIHGAQLIVEYNRHPESWLPTLLYLGGARFDEVWSCLAMIGVRADTGAEFQSQRVLKVLNLTLFADITDYATVGVETNLETSMRGDSALMVMPQLHWEITDYFMIQSGAGGRFASGGSMGEAAFRIIRSF